MNECVCVISIFKPVDTFSEPGLKSVPLQCT